MANQHHQSFYDPSTKQCCSTITVKKVKADLCLGDLHLFFLLIINDMTWQSTWLYIYRYIYMHINSWKFQWHRCSRNLWIMYTMEGVRYVTNECMKTSEYIYGHTICNTLLQTILFIPLLLPIYSKFSYLLLKVLSCYHFCSFLFKIPTV